MSIISEIVDRVLQSGYLSTEAEEQMRLIFTLRHDLEDIEALTRLQQAATSGRVTQQSRQL
ncbi:MAG: hypothetical protein F6K36_23765 [Symploca sp. SIO3C6]|uniref:Uncharacterized protein n=1 Tax=Symploca sp. SIO1C4 TaxID=2607765 RepID=A0A6B3NG14_9CYAN|nr:hypothetical protein [Symploca sp. SIO3C6]NER29845.1 hypothetical protein [Symploca sp. SIO1C4]NET06498.1 hypothetical protein [Symploca sp. SIO2B6]NET51650.1 hypothetical protein [Merismopedia sp. SIO2A8]